MTLTLELLKGDETRLRAQVAEVTGALAYNLQLQEFVKKEDAAQPRDRGTTEGRDVSEQSLAPEGRDVESEGEACDVSELQPNGGRVMREAHHG